MMHRVIFPSLQGLLLGALVLSFLPGSARGADEIDPIDPIYVQYHGGRLLPQVRVQTLFWGDWWNQSDEQQNQLRDYLNQFFRDLFADGRYMANLEQYSSVIDHIGNGVLEQTDTVFQNPNPGPVTDTQIKQLLASEINAERLPTADSNTLYYIFLPEGVTFAYRSNTDLGYHQPYVDPAGNVRGAYAVIVYARAPHSEVEPNNPRLITGTLSHELAEAVTNPYDNGWYYLSDFGEIGDIPNDLYEYGWITREQHWDVLNGPQGQRYLVEQVWSNRGGRPVAFQSDR